MTQPWAPVPANVGKNPVAGVGGERGSVAFAGDNQTRADGTVTYGANPERGPLHGERYYETDPGLQTAAANARGQRYRQTPNLPTTPTAAAVAGRIGRVTFTPVTATGGSPITGYTATSTPGGLTATAAANATTVDVTLLVVGTAYTFVVTANNAAGASAPSAASNSITGLV